MASGGTTAGEGIAHPANCLRTRPQRSQQPP